MTEESEETVEKLPAGETPKADDVEAVGAVVKALRPFSEDVRQRIVDSALTLLGTAPSSRTLGRPPPAPEAAPEAPPADRLTEAGAPPARDVRELREQKQPRTANEMAAVAAYYLSRLAPTELRQDFITSADVKKYFEQAGFLQPGDPLMTLVNAKNAGYFDSLGGGRYRLNPVGFNLVTHGLPKKNDEGGTVRVRPKRNPKRAAQKPSRKR